MVWRIFLPVFLMSCQFFNKLLIRSNKSTHCWKGQSRQLFLSGWGRTGFLGLFICWTLSNTYSPLYVRNLLCVALWQMFETVSSYTKAVYLDIQQGLDLVIIVNLCVRLWFMCLLQHNRYSLTQMGDPLNPRTSLNYTDAIPARSFLSVLEKIQHVHVSLGQHSCHPLHS